MPFFYIMDKTYRSTSVRPEKAAEGTQSHGNLTQDHGTKDRGSGELTEARSPGKKRTLPAPPPAEENEVTRRVRERVDLPLGEACPGCDLCPGDMYSDSLAGMLCLRCDAIQRCPNCGNYSDHGDHWKLYPRFGLVECSGCGADWHEAPWREFEVALKKYGRHPGELPPPPLIRLVGLE